ncbi:MAG: M13 family metallopeptidase, partial [Muribaculaceae bacterium]|nr:M13 family metallopeptidase [Muribaculaceae bacterium]
MKFNKAMMVLAAAALPMAMSAQEHLKSLDANGIDKNVPASADFYQHVNNGWMESHPLTPEYARYGQFNILNDSSNNRVKRIVTNLAKTNPAKGTNAYKIAALYEAGMDSVRRNQLGATPIKADLDRIEKTEPADMKKLFLWLHQNYTSPLFGAGPMENLANSK